MVERYIAKYGEKEFDGLMIPLYNGASFLAQAMEKAGTIEDTVKLAEVRSYSLRQNAVGTTFRTIRSTVDTGKASGSRCSQPTIIWLRISPTSSLPIWAALLITLFGMDSTTVRTLPACSRVSRPSRSLSWSHCSKPPS